MNGPLIYGGKRVKIDIIGAGTPGPAADRFGSCYVINIGDEKLMFDCGPASTHKLVKMGIGLTSIDNLFFTHHHFDHDVDYPCFILSRWNLFTGGGKRPPGVRAEPDGTDHT